MLFLALANQDPSVDLENEVDVGNITVDYNCTSTFNTFAPYFLLNSANTVPGKLHHQLASVSLVCFPFANTA